MVTKMTLEIDAHFVRLHWLELFHYLGNLVVLPVSKYNLIWCKTIDYRKGHRVPARCPTTKSTSKMKQKHYDVESSAKIQNLWDIREDYVYKLAHFQLS